MGRRKHYNLTAIRRCLRERCGVAIEVEVWEGSAVYSTWCANANANPHWTPGRESLLSCSCT